MEAIEIINSVEQFYNSAWDKLIFVISISVVFLGFFIPLIINWWQKRSLKIAEDSLKDDLTKFITDEFIKKSEKLEELFDKKMSAVEAKTFHLQGNIHENDELYDRALTSFIIAGYKYLQGEDFVNLIRINNLIITTMPKLTEEQLEELETEDKQPSGYIKELEENNVNGIFHDVIKDIKRAITKIKKQKKPAIKKPAPSK